MRSSAGMNQATHNRQGRPAWNAAEISVDAGMVRTHAQTMLSATPAAAKSKKQPTKRHPPTVLWTCGRETTEWGFRRMAKGGVQPGAGTVAGRGRM
jgi:hypothetical protein